jgi:hypothetical protein
MNVMRSSGIRHHCLDMPDSQHLSTFTSSSRTRGRMRKYVYIVDHWVIKYHIIITSLIIRIKCADYARLVIQDPVHPHSHSSFSHVYHDVKKKEDKIPVYNFSLFL